MKTTKEYNDTYYKKNKEEIIKKTTAWNKKNKKYRRGYYNNWKAKHPNKRREDYLKKTYKITLEEYELIKKIQEGRCAICLEKHNRLVIDHCHKTNKVRCLLCTTCNAGIGQFRDNIKLLENAIAYLKRFE